MEQNSSRGNNKLIIEKTIKIRQNKAASQPTNQFLACTFTSHEGGGGSTKPDPGEETWDE